MMNAAAGIFLAARRKPRLPYDAEVEYLESTGTQWIDTGVECTSDLDVDFVISTATAPNRSTLGIIQRAPAGYSGYFRYHYSPSSSRASFWVQINNTGSASILSIDFTPNKIYHWTVNPTLGIANCNGTNVSFAALPQGVRSGLNFYIFARNGFDSFQSMPSKVYSFKMWQDGVLVRDYIPVRKGTVGYLYDRVTRRLFGNAGTGDFVLGPDVVPVEYIESHGTEWIATGMAAQRFLQISIDAQTIAPLNTSGWFGAIGGTGQSRHHFYINSSGVGGYAIGGSSQALTGFNPLERFKLSYSLPSATATVDGIGSLSFAYNFSSSNPNYTLFAFDNNGTIIPSKWRIYSFDASLYNSDTKISLHPVRVGTEGAMMDVLTRRIYRNAGTGAFTYGNDLKYPISAE